MKRSPPVFSRDQLIAVEARQIDERSRAALGDAVAVLAVMREQTRAEAERDRQTGGTEAEHVAGIGRGLAVGGRAAAPAGWPCVMRAAASVQVRSRPITSSRLVVVRSSAATYDVRLLRRDDAALMLAEERFDREVRIVGMRAASCRARPARHRSRRGLRLPRPPHLPPSESRAGRAAWGDLDRLP